MHMEGLQLGIAGPLGGNQHGLRPALKACLCPQRALGLHLLLRRWAAAAAAAALTVGLGPCQRRLARAARVGGMEPAWLSQLSGKLHVQGSHATCSMVM